MLQWLLIKHLNTNSRSYTTALLCAVRICVVISHHGLCCVFIYSYCLCCSKVGSLFSFSSCCSACCSLRSSWRFSPVWRQQQSLWAEPTGPVPPRISNGSTGEWRDQQWQTEAKLKTLYLLMNDDVNTWSQLIFWCFKKLKLFKKFRQKSCKACTGLQSATTLVEHVPKNLSTYNFHLS